jgi:hypothetical protein
MRTTIDGLTIYDLAPQASRLWVVAGPAGHYVANIDEANLPEGFRWVTEKEWEELQALAEFNHRLEAGFELCDLPLPVGVETDVILAGEVLTPFGRLYGVFDSPWHAHQPDAGSRAICVLGSGSLPRCLQELAARNTEKLTGAIECRFQTDGDSGSIVAASWRHACGWLESEITPQVVKNGGWGWIESPNDDEGRFVIGDIA